MIERVLGAVGVVEGQVDVFHEGPGWILGRIYGAGGEFGVIGAVAPGDLDGSGAWAGVIERDRRGKLQVRLRGAIDTDLSTEQLRAYLGSGLVWHVGPATAAGIVDVFGSGTLPILMHDPDRLVAVKGITEQKLPGIRESLAKTLPLAGIVGLLAPFGIGQSVCRAIAKRYGRAAAAEIRANPWLLSMEFSGVTFRTADRIAIRLGVPPESPIRHEAAMVHLVSAAVREGHTVTSEADLLSTAADLLDLAPDDLRGALDRLLARGALVPVLGTDGIARADVGAAEARLAENIEALLAAEVGDTVPDAAVDTIEAMDGIVFDATQRAAIRGALGSGVAIITGGPGTGKTTIVRAICDLAEGAGLTVALMSFTGKAAKVMSEATRREATTIHRYLRFTPGNPTGTFAGPEEPAGVVIVDEVSMLDVPLADELVSWLRPGSRLVLVGDVDQLPAIGPGNVLGDLVGSPLVPVFRLDTIHRTAASSGIPELARSINEGRAELPFDRRTTRLVVREDGEAIAAWIAEHFERYRDRVDEFQVLAPMKKGPAGVHRLNAIIAEIVRDEAARSGPAITHETYDMRAGDRIIWTQNDKELGIFNGEIGALREVRRGAAIVEFDGQTYVVSPDKYSSFTLAYALTVHKAQGSQYPVVLVAMDRGAHVMLYRRLLYTAITRARETVAIIGQPEAVATAVERHDSDPRRTALGTLLAEFTSLVSKRRSPRSFWL